MYGKKIKQLRKNAGLKQADLANLLGVSRPNISFWENADYPPLEAIDKICRLLGLELWQFFSEDSSGTRAKDLPVGCGEAAELFEEIAQLSRNEYDDLLKIIAIYMKKSGSSRCADPAGADARDNEQETRNGAHKALIHYTERYLRIM